MVVGDPVISGTLLLHELSSGHDRIIDQGVSFFWPMISQDGRHLFVIKKANKEVAALCEYEISSGQQITCVPNAAPDELVLDEYAVYFNFEVTPYAWSPDQQLLLLHASTSKRPEEQRRHAIILRASDGALIDDVSLPDFTGSLRLTNDGRIVMITYVKEQAGIVVYDTHTHTFSQRIVLGNETPLIVYTP